MRLDEIQEKELKLNYRATFSTHAGRVVLQHILWELRFLQKISTDEEKTLHNYARRILYWLDADESQIYENLVGHGLDLPPLRGEGKEFTS